jgi:regulator of protease activity HflC (stomatin/prohibitin superfamily)
MLIVIGVLLGVFLALISIGGATVSIWLPLLAKRLENDPQNPSKFAATTKVGPSKFKFVMKGGKVVRGLVNFSGHKTKGGLGAPDAFEIVAATQTGRATEEMGPIDAFVYHHTGHRVLNPFSEHVYTYEFPRTEEIMGADGELAVVGVTDVSDYFLLAEQTYSFSIIDADTGGGENVKVTLKGKTTFEIFNPYKAAFADKKWLQQAVAAIQVRGRNFVRARDFDTLLGEVGKEGSELKDAIGLDLAKVSTEIEGGAGTERLFGVRVRRVLVETIEMTDAEAEKSRTAKYTAERQAEVVCIAAAAEAKRKKMIRAAEAESESGYIATVSAATKAEGAIGLKMMDQQTQLGIAQKAGTVIMQVGGNPATINPIDAQILEELRKNNANPGTKPR